VTERARKVDVAPSRQLARVMDDAVVVPGARRTGRDGAGDLAPLALADPIPDPDFTCRSGVG
jgi:hypothetical protein